MKQHTQPLNPLWGILAPLALYLVLRIFPDLDFMWGNALGHFQLVSATAIISLLIALAIGIVGLRVRNLQIIYESLAFISLAGLFSLHGLATPGFILGPTRLVGIASQLSVIFTALWLYISSTPAQNGLTRWLASSRRWLPWAWTGLIALAGWAAFNDPNLVEWVPVDQAPLRYAVALITIWLSTVAGQRYYRSYRFSRFPFQLALTYAAGWVAVSQVIITTGQTFAVSWWIYHFLLLFAVIGAVFSLLVQFPQRDALVQSARSLVQHDPAEQLRSALTPSLRALVVATEARDKHTGGHSNRVAFGAVALGMQLNLPPDDLRALAHGSIIHDIGKVQVPDQILNKPGPLTPEERIEINRHTLTGYEMGAQLGYMSEELALIRSHHERMDGSGYPDGLRGEEIPLLARILSVADVYDALVSKRAYREAWSPEEALDYLNEHKDSQFDAKLVDVWAELLREGKPLRPGTGELKL